VNCAKLEYKECYNGTLDALYNSLGSSASVSHFGLFGAVSASTLAAAMVMLEEQAMHYEAWVPALYPFMDIPALVLAIVLSQLHGKKEKKEMIHKNHPVQYKKIIKESIQGSALLAMLLGLALYWEWLHWLCVRLYCDQSDFANVIVYYLL
jgi:hypothetical protein